MINAYQNFIEEKYFVRMQIINDPVYSHFLS